MLRSVSALLVVASLFSAQVPAPKPQPSAAMLELTRSITENELRGHVSFLASDKLEGRATPSAGLDVAAEYIASRFRAAGLEPAGDQDYFQTVDMAASRALLEGFSMSLSGGGREIVIEPKNVGLGRQLDGGLNLASIPVVKVPPGTLPDATIEGKAVLTHTSEVRDVKAPERSKYAREISTFRDELASRRPAVIINVNPRGRAFGASGTWVADSKSRQNAIPSLTVTAREAYDLYEELPSGETGWAVSLNVAASEPKRFVGRNVVGLIRGSDPVLKDTYVLLSAHYDHVGTRDTGDDRIFNGANDNASGTATLLEIAAAFGKLNPPPKRTLVFVAFFGEELGLLGSRSYVNSPVVPLERTVANLNFEHTGRTDDKAGSQAGKAAVTGFDFSSVSAILQEAGSYTGYQILNRAGNEDYFNRSDNEPLALAGIPAHTIVVSIEYPDYHGAKDHWYKLDYPNMAELTRTMAIGALLIANSSEAPQWNASDPRTKAYRMARERNGKASGE